MFVILFDMRVNGPALIIDLTSDREVAVGTCYIITDTLLVARDLPESACTYLDLHDICSNRGDNRSFIFVFFAKLSLEVFNHPQK